MIFKNSKIVFFVFFFALLNLVFVQAELNCRNLHNEYESASPNLISFSDFSNENNFGLSSCTYQEETYSRDHVTFDNQNEMFDSTDFPGRNGYLKCELNSRTNRVFNNLKPNTDYLFSAWVVVTTGPSATISSGQNSKQFTNVGRWTRVDINATSDNNGVLTISFQGNFLMDMVQLEERRDGQFERTTYFLTHSTSECCEENSCWTGHRCVNYGSNYRQQDWLHPFLNDAIDAFGYESFGKLYSAHPVFVTNNDEMGYVCNPETNNFEFKEKTYRWISGWIPGSGYGGASTLGGEILPPHGFCDPSSCFVGRNYAGIVSSNFKEIDRYDCINSGQSFNNMYCDSGVWRSNIERVASFLSQYAEDNFDDFSIYCGNYDDVLDYYSDFLRGLEGSAHPHDYFGNNPLQNFRQKYVDDSCILVYGDSPDNYIFSVSSNMNSDDPLNNFLGYFLDAPGPYVSTCRSSSHNSRITPCVPASRILYSRSGYTLFKVGESSVYSELNNQRMPSFSDIDSYVDGDFNSLNEFFRVKYSAYAFEFFSYDVLDNQQIDNSLISYDVAKLTGFEDFEIDLRYFNSVVGRSSGFTLRSTPYVDFIEFLESMSVKEPVGDAIYFERVDDGSDSLFSDYLKYLFFDMSCNTGGSWAFTLSPHYYGSLDRFWKVGSNCCGGGFRDYLFFNSVLDDFSDFGSRACWNGRAIGHGRTIDTVQINKFFNDPDSSDNYELINLLRVDPKNPFSMYDSNRYLRNFDFNTYNTPNLNDLYNDLIHRVTSVPELFDVVEGYEIFLAEGSYEVGLVSSASGFLASDVFRENSVIFHDLYNVVLLESMNFLDLAEGLEYVVVIRTDNPDRIFLSIYNKNVNYPLNLNKLTPSFYNELGLDDSVVDYYYAIFTLEDSLNYKFRLALLDPDDGSESIGLSEMFLVPRASVLNVDGAFMVCENELGANPFPDMEDDLLNEIIFGNPIPHCLENYADNVCSPTGVWIGAYDDSGVLLDSVSSSPNLLVDSSFWYGGSFEVDACNLNEGVDSISNVQFENFDEIMGGSDFPSNKYYLSCKENFELDLSEIANLEDGEVYIFSAWIRSDQNVEISTAEDSTNLIGDGVWRRVEVSGVFSEETLAVNFDAVFDIDMIQIEKSNELQTERGHYFRTDQVSACCPSNYCWDGNTCRDYSVTDYLNVDFYTNNFEAGYVCMGGNYEFVEKSYRWLDRSTNFDSSSLPDYGFCEVGNCFVGRGDVIDRLDCVDNGGSLNGYFCENGFWNTRLESIISSINPLLDEKSFSIYCGDYEDVLIESARGDGFFSTPISFGNFNLNMLDFACVLRYSDNVQSHSNFENSVYILPFNDGVLDVFSLSDNLTDFLPDEHVKYNDVFYLSDDSGFINQIDGLILDSFDGYFQVANLKEFVSMNYESFTSESFTPDIIEKLYRINSSNFVFKDFFYSEIEGHSIFMNKIMIMDIYEDPTNFYDIYLFNMTDFDLHSSVSEKSTVSDLFERSENSVIYSDSGNLYVFSKDTELVNDVFEEWFLYSFYFDGDEGPDFCELTVNYAHLGFDSFRPYSDVRNIELSDYLFSQWAGTNTNGFCCGDDLDDPGIVTSFGDGIFQVCTVDANTGYGWHYNSDIWAVYNITHNPDFWRLNLDSNYLDTDSESYNYIVGTSQSGFAFCNYTYSGQGMMYNTDCDDANVECLGPGNFYNFDDDSRGYMCVNASMSAGGKLVDDLVGDLAFAVCDLDANEYSSYFVDDKFNSLFLNPGNFMTTNSLDGNNEIMFCSTSGTFLSNSDAHRDSGSCGELFNYLHIGVDIFRPDYNLNQYLFSQWSDEVSELNCCGASLDSVGYLEKSGEFLYVCTASSTGTYGWISNEYPGRVYNISNKEHFWTDNWSMYSEPIEFNYLVATSESALIACDENYDQTNGGFVVHNAFYDDGLKDSSDLYDYFNHMDCSNEDVYCMGLGGMINLPDDGRGFLCVDNGVVSPVTDMTHSFTSAESPSRPNLAIALCNAENYETTVDDYLNRGNAIHLEPGDYIRTHGVEGDVWFCTETGSFVKDLNAFAFNTPDDENIGGSSVRAYEYEVEDLTCEYVNLRRAFDSQRFDVRGLTFADYYEPLDRFWRTGTYCCGNNVFYTNDYVYEYFSDTTKHLYFGPRACWNNIAILDGQTIDKTVNSVWPHNQDQGFEQPYNLLRVNSLNPFTFTSDSFLRNWDVDVDSNNEIPVSTIITSSNSISFYDYVGDTGLRNYDYDVVNVTSRYPVQLTKNLDYMLLVHHIGIRADFEIYLINEFDEIYEVELERIPPDYAAQVGLSEDYSRAQLYAKYRPAENANYKLRIVVSRNDNPMINHAAHLQEIILKPFPLVLNHEGEFFTCYNKSNDIQMYDLQDTKTETLMFSPDFSYGHCDVKDTASGLLVCNPEGHWISGTSKDSNIPSHRSQSQRSLTSLSRSPNIIEDSSFKYGGSFDIDGCSFIAEPSNFLTSIGRYGLDERMDTSEDAGRSYLKCDNVDASVRFRDSNDEDLNGEYIFSAWVRSSDGTGSISSNQESVNIENSELWQRIDVIGSDDNGDVVITFSGNFEIDMVQLEERHDGQFESSKYFRTDRRYSCCPENSCWNGNRCVYMDSTSGVPDQFSTYGEYILANPDFVTNNDEMGYICIDGPNYEFREKSYRWIESDDWYETLNVLSGVLVDSDYEPLPEHGFCNPGECFVGLDKYDVEYTSDFHRVDRTSCIESGNEFKGRYCDNGNWRFNFERVASTLANVGSGQSAYSLFCGDYKDVLNYYSYDFSGMGDENRVNLFDQKVFEENFAIRYLDHACVLKYEGSDNNIIIALPLNHDLLSEVRNPYAVGISSLLNYFSATPNEITACEREIAESTDNLIECIPDKNLYYYINENVLMFVGSVTDQIPSAISIDEFNSLYQSSILNNLVGYFESSIDDEDNFVEGIHYSEDNLRLEELALRSIDGFGSYDGLFIYNDGVNHMYVLRQKIMDIAEITNHFNYVFAMNVSDFGIDQSYAQNYGVISPLSRDKELHFSDIFNQTVGAIVYQENDEIYVFSTNRQNNRHYFDNWFTFTGRLRGDLEFPR